MDVNAPPLPQESTSWKTNVLIVRPPEFMMRPNNTVNYAPLTLTTQTVNVSAAQLDSTTAAVYKNAYAMMAFTSILTLNNVWLAKAQQFGKIRPTHASVQITSHIKILWVENAQSAPVTYDSGTGELALAAQWVPCSAKDVDAAATVLQEWNTAKPGALLDDDCISIISGICSQI